MNNRSRQITYGDRIFARVMKNGREVLNFVTEKVSTIGELMAALKEAMKDLKGLVMIHIRNYHQGWGEERPLILRG